MTESEKRVVVFAPYAQDAKSIVQLLASQGLAAEVAVTLREVVNGLDENLGAVLMSEEALVQGDWSDLVRTVREQPPWSSFPFILLIGQKRLAGQMEAVYGLFPPEVANVVVLERPMSSTALLSAIRQALAGRRRQFITKSHLDELERNTRLQQLMTRELAHRVKNTIAMLQSIVRQTMRSRPDLEDVEERILDRFSALARTHDLLFSTDFQEAEFGELVRQTVKIHGQDFVVSGPAVMFSPQAALSFTLVIHELATNSVKYGALSTEGMGGKVTVSWGIEDGLDSSVLRFCWQESGGPLVREPVAKGFGTRLITATLAGLGKVEQSYGRDGFQLHFVGPLAGLTATNGTDLPQPNLQ